MHVFRATQFLKILAVVFKVFHYKFKPEVRMQFNKNSISIVICALFGMQALYMLKCNAHSSKCVYECPGQLLDIEFEFTLFIGAN